MENSDFDLVCGIRSGDKGALDTLVRRWYPRIYGYVFKLTCNEQDSYDVTQEIFIAMMQSIQSYRMRKKFDSWLFTIAHNKCMDYFRAQKKTGTTDNVQEDVPSPEDLLDDSVTVSVAVRDALDKLTDLQREAVILRYYYQFSVREIAQMTGAPLPTVKSRLKAAGKILSEYLQEGFQ